MQLFGIANIGLDDNMLVCFTVQFILFSRNVSLYFDSRIYEQQYIDMRESKIGQDDITFVCLRVKLIRFKRKVS